MGSYRVIDHGQVGAETCNADANTGVATSESGRCGLKIAAPDPGDTRPLIRPLKFAAACGGFSARVDMGPTGGLQAERVTKLRYIFDPGNALIELLREKARAAKDRYTSARVIISQTSARPDRVDVRGFSLEN